jgi:hypothetical protein
MAAPGSLTPEMVEAILEGPAMAPPPGVLPNFINPPSFGTAMLAVEILFLVLPTLSIFIRLWTCIRINRKAHLEDCECAIESLSQEYLTDPLQI